MAEIWPTMRLTPIDDQFPPLVNWVKTTVAEFLGAITHRTMIIVKKAKQ